jgi:ATP/maltotriose-dependent transcriptional regulator MalT
VTVLLAPAGYGKTIALRQFIADARIAPVRYDVREENAALLGFTRGLIEALGPVVPSARAALALAYERAAAAPEPGRELAAWLAEHLQTFVGSVIIDDFHNAGAHPSIAAFVEKLVQRTHEHIRWVIATRAAASLPISSWLAYEMMDLPIDENDLAFSLAEATEAARLAGSAIDSDEIAQLHALTKGWPTAFTFALRSSTRSQDLRQIAAGTREMIFGYLAEQVFRTLGTAERDFLLETCLYDHVDALALAHDGYDDAAFLIARLRKNVAFISTESPNVIRYHDLFREFLENELRARGERCFEEVALRTARTLEGLGRLSEALSTYARVCAADDIERILERDGISFIEHGRADVVQAALTVLPGARQLNSPIILAIKAIFESNAGNWDRADAWFQIAIDRARDEEMRLRLTQRHAVDLLRRDRLDCIELLEPLVNSRIAAREPVALACATLATAYVHAGRNARAKSSIERALATVAASGDDDVRASVNHAAAYVAYRLGDADDAVRSASAAVKLAESRGLFDLCARAYTVLYSVCSDKDDDPELAMSYLRNIGACAAKAGSRDVELYALLGAYSIEADRGNDEALAELDQRISEFEMRHSRQVLEALVPARALRAAWGGDFAGSYRIIAGTAERQLSPDRRALRWSQIGLFAAAAGLRVNAEAAIEACWDELRAGRDMTFGSREKRARTLLALTYVLIGKSASAHRILAELERDAVCGGRERAMVAAIRAFYIHIEGERSTRELMAALGRLREYQYGGMARLLETLPLPEITTSRFARLTPSEMTILRALARGASSKAIALATGRSAQTVDVHVKSLVRKLGCSGRREALALAIEHGLVV